MSNIKATVKEESKNLKFGFALRKDNYIVLIVSFVIIIIGYMLMTGGGSHNPNEFNNDIFSFRRITLAPIVVMIGYMTAIYAIMKKPKE